MPSELILIDNLIQQHEAIRGHLSSICLLVDCVKDDLWEGLKELNPGQLNTLQEKHLNLKQTMGYLDEGIKRHHGEEELILPPLIGNPLVEAIRIEHREMRKQLNEVNYALNNVDARGFLDHNAYLKAIIENLCRLINDNTVEEDVILRLLKRRYI